MVGSKVMALLSRYSSLIDLTSSSLNSNSIATPRKMTSGNYCKHLNAIQWSDQKLWPFWAVILVWPDQTSLSPSSDSIVTQRKIAFRNSYKTISAIQQSYKKLWPFLAIMLVWPDQTSLSLISDSIATPRKTTSGNSSKMFLHDPPVKSKVMALLSCYSSPAQQDLHITE